ALAPTIPTSTGRAVLLDCGANAECTVEYLLQFAYLGSYYASRVLGVDKPRVGLLNIGAEEEKGDALRRETFLKLTEAGERGDINFVGNIEAKEAMLGECDVIVADGFSGNVMLKTIEGAGKLMSGMLKKMLLKNALTKLSALMLKDSLSEFKKTLDPNEVGGTALLGISKPVIKAHGSSNDKAFCNAIKQAVEVANSRIAEDIAHNIDKMRLGGARSTE
ncbi:MAG: phosphate--acyl-ACP acyltransferase, partial [Oscillospiraceae bacterium]|nr:phosphate--acyl-ACP acyltransferase [Oscillospiraceae bacterium]